MEHLRGAIAALERAIAAAEKLDEAEHDGARIIGWGAVFQEIHGAELEVEGLKIVVAEDTLENLDRNVEQLSRREAWLLRLQMNAVRKKALRALERG